MKIRRNSHYGHSPIACPLNSAVFSGKGDIDSVFSACPRGRYFYFKEVFVMKKTKFTAFLLAIFFVVVLTVTACADGTAAASGAVVLESSDKFVVIEANATGGSLEEAMAALKETGALTYEGSESEYGFYLTSVNGYTPDDDANEYWAVYTTLGEYDGVEYSNSEYGTYDYNGKTCASASYGVSGIPMIEGELYVIAIATY